jgi:hypothetical protein
MVTIVTEVTEVFAIMVKGPVRRRRHPSSSYAKLPAFVHYPGSWMSAQPIYKVIFMNQGKVFEIYARSVSHGTLFGFIEVEKLVFGTRSTVVVDPSEERIQSEFSGVTRTYLPMHSIVRIDEVEKQGISKVTTVEGGNVAQFPMPIYAPRGEGGKGGSGDK